MITYVAREVLSYIQDKYLAYLWARSSGTTFYLSSVRYKVMPNCSKEE